MTESDVITNDAIQADPLLLREILAFDPETGRMWWKERGRHWFATERGWKIFNTRAAGKPALTSVGGRGYMQGKILNQSYLAHVVMVALVTGKWPVGRIIHLNGNALDNSIGNLKEGTHVESQKGRKLNINNTSGAAGVYSFRDKWKAQIVYNGKAYYLGLHETVELASGVVRYVARRTGSPETRGAGGLLGDTGLLKPDPDLRAKLDKKVAEIRDE